MGAHSQRPPLLCTITASGQITLTILLVSMHRVTFSSNPLKCIAYFQRRGLGVQGVGCRLEGCEGSTWQGVGVVLWVLCNSISFCSQASALRVAGENTSHGRVHVGFVNSCLGMRITRVGEAERKDLNLVGTADDSKTCRQRE